MHFNVCSDQKQHVIDFCFLEHGCSKIKSKVRTHQDDKKTLFYALDVSDQKNKERYGHANQNAKIMLVFSFIFTQKSKVAYGHTQMIENHLFSVHDHFLRKRISMYAQAQIKTFNSFFS